MIDPMTADFLEATQGHSVILNFSTIPAWMFKTDKSVTYPDDPNQPVWDYTQGAEFRDATMKEVGDYYGRLFPWYTQGGFTDKAGKRHESGFHYDIPYWEVLNEIEYEHQMSPELYARVYDSVVTAIKRRVAPQKPNLSVWPWPLPSQSPEQFEYFLNPRNHQPGIPLDFISYHFYAVLDSRPKPGHPAIHVLRTSGWIPKYGPLCGVDSKETFADNNNYPRRSRRHLRGRFGARQRRPRHSADSKFLLEPDLFRVRLPFWRDDPHGYRRCGRVPNWSAIQPNFPVFPWWTGIPANRMPALWGPKTPA